MLDVSRQRGEVERATRGKKAERKGCKSEEREMERERALGCRGSHGLLQHVGAILCQALFVALKGPLGAGGALRLGKHPEKKEGLGRVGLKPPAMTAFRHKSPF